MSSSPYSINNETTRSSCDECRKRKLRCTPERGGCARCTARGLSCTFSARKRMGRPRTVNRDRDRRLPPTPPREPDYSPPLDLGEFEWLMSPMTSTSSTGESPLLMPLPTFDQPLWDALGFPSTPLSSTLTSTLPSPGFPFESTVPDLLASQAAEMSADEDPNKLDPKPDTRKPEQPEGTTCFCNSTQLIDTLRCTLRSSVGAEEALRSAARASGTCARSRSCSVCASDPSTPIAAFTVLSLVAQILAASVDRVLTLGGAGGSGGAELRSPVEHADSTQLECEEETSTGQSLTDEAKCSPDREAAVRDLSLTPVMIGNITLSSASSRRVLLVALQDSLRALRDAGSGLGMGDMTSGLEKQVADLDAKISASLNQP